MANTSERKHSSYALRLIYAVALIFLCVGLCVLGSFRGTGDAYELKTQGTGDAQTPTVVFQLDKTMTELNEEGEEVTRYFRVTNVYINVGAAYTQKGESVTLRAEAVASPTSSASSSSGRRRELTFSYTNAQGGRSRRVVAIYGIFSHEGSTYIVGLDDKSGSLRTFRVDRMDRALRPGNPYTIPADFDIRDFLFLSFDFGAQDAATASFTFPAEQTEGVIAAITHDRGALSRDEDGTWMWTVDVRSLDGAASFALEHAHDGMRPAAPQELIDRWCSAIDKVVNAHVAR